MRSTEIVSIIAAQAPPQGNPYSGLIMMILMFVIMYFLLIRPQRQRQKELEARVAQLRVGDKVVTSAGIHGLVTNVKERTLMVKVADNVKIEFEKSAIASTTPKGEGGDASESPSEEKESS